MLEVVKRMSILLISLKKMAETTVKDEGYARLGAQGKSIEFTNNYYISGFRFNKSGEGLIYGSDKK